MNNNNKYDYFLNFSIFEKKEYLEYLGDFSTKYHNNTLSELEKACIGSMLGMAIGDAIGARVEFKHLDYEYKELTDMGDSPAGKFNLQPGQWTMTVQWVYV